MFRPSIWQSATPQNKSGESRLFSSISARETFARRHTLHIPAKRAIATYIPKNACTTLRYSIAISNGRPEAAETITYVHSGMPEMLASKSDLANCTYAFILLRCPYRRIASAFLDKAVNEDSLAPSLFPLKRRLFHRSRPDTSEAGIASQHAKVMALTFAGFLALLRKCEPRRLNHHFSPQSNFLLKQGYNDYFALENLAEAEATLREKIDLRLVDRGTHGVSRRKKSDVDASTLTIAELLELRAAGYAPAYETLFTKATRRAVDAFYAKDLALYKKHFGSKNLLLPS
jgi:Sulfotransferase family